MVSCTHVLIFYNICMPEFLKTGLAKIGTHSTTWQLAIKKPISDAGQ